MNHYHICPTVSPETRRQARRELEAALSDHPLGAITEDKIVQALSHSDPDDYFVTTRLYWECECPEEYFRPQQMAYCENCGSFAEECPDARIHELRANGIHLDYHDPTVRATMDQHNIRSRDALLIAKKAV